jgi:putative glutamine amidotransferase
VEAVELPGAPAWTLGVQWHPEADDTEDLRVMRALVSAAERRAGRTVSRTAPRTAPR